MNHLTNNKYISTFLFIELYESYHIFHLDTGGSLEDYELIIAKISASWLKWDTIELCRANVRYHYKKAVNIREKIEQIANKDLELYNSKQTQINSVSGRNENDYKTNKVEYLNTITDKDTVEKYIQLINMGTDKFLEEIYKLVQIVQGGHENGI